MKKSMISMLLLLTGCLWLTGIAQASYYSDFGSSAEGWTTEGATAPLYHATGGNPGGYISAADTSDTWFRFVSPDSWAGNWSAYANGTIQFDLNPLNYNANQYNHYVEIWSGANYMWWETNIYPPQGVWTHFQVELTDANFTKVGATFSQILQNVTAIKILADLYDGYDTTGLDNVRVDAAPSLHSDFGSSTEGWTTEGATATLYHATGGNPGGYISATDNLDTWWRFVSPNSWAGNWSVYANGTIQFDLNPLNYNANQYNHYVEIWSGANYMWWETNIYPPQGVWTHFQVRLTDANFTKVGATFSQILQNVTAIKILGDLYDSYDTTGLDNVRVDASGGVGSADQPWRILLMD